MRGFWVGVACVAASPALAQVTAEQVWENLQAPVSALGGETEAVVTRDGDTLRIADTVFRFALPFELGTIEMRGTGFDLTENGDGTVAVVYPADLALTVAMTRVGEEIGRGTFTMDAETYVMTASGTPGDITYDYTLDESTFSIVDVLIPDDPDYELTLDGTGTGLSGYYRITQGPILELTSVSENGNIEITSRMSDRFGVDSSGGQVISGGTTEVAFLLPSENVDLLNLGQALRNGLSVRIVQKDTRITQSDRTLIDGQMFVSQTVSYLADELTYVINENGMSGGGVNSDISVEMSFGEGPGSGGSGTIERITGDLEMPLLETSGAAPFGFTMGIEQLAMSDDVWAMFDPGSQLPRAPVNVDLDMAGEMTNKMDLLDVNGWMALRTGSVPVELNSLDLRRLAISGLGADMEADGAFTFDNSDMVTFGGMPAPDGTLNMRMTGFNTMIDALIATGLIADEEALGARMMIGMVAVPGEGEDSLTSEIEIRPDGQILANGQRLR